MADTLTPEHRKRGWWYSAGSCCTAKWFAPFRSTICARCGSKTLLQKQHDPPWWDHETVHDDQSPVRNGN